MARPGIGSYSDGKYYTEQSLQVTGDDVSFSGTIATAAELYRTTAFTNIRALDISTDIITGGTAAGPSFTINQSLAGTGTLVPFGTVTFGTNADGTVLDGAVTETAIAAGDDIVLKSVAGTVASTPVFICNLAYVENFVCS